MLIESPPTWRPTFPPTGDPDWDRMCQSLVDAVATATPHGLGQGAEKVLDAAFDAWPVRTGTSRDALALTYETTETTCSAVLDDDVAYKNEIHQGATVADLVVWPAEAAMPQIVGDLERLITAIGRA